MTMPFFFNQYDIHLGTSWDVAKLHKINPRKVMEYIAEGLYNIALEIESGKLNINSKFRGNTFYLKEGTIKRFNFSTRRMNAFELALFIMNYIELFIINSILRKKICFVPINNVMIVFFTGSEIIKNKEVFGNFIQMSRRKNLGHKSKYLNTIRPQSKKIVGVSIL